MSSVTTFENPDADPAARRRMEWAESLKEHMRLRGAMTRKQLQRALLERGVDVSLQAIGYWLKGTTSPRPEIQAELAAVLCVPVRSLFPIEPAA